MPRPLALLLLAVCLVPNLRADESTPTPAKLPEFGEVAVVAWDVEDKWSFGGDRFHKKNRFYQPVDGSSPFPWAITEIDITTWFQQDVIDGWAPSLEALIGEKWKDAKKFMEDKKYGGSCHFVFVATDKKFTLFHDKGKPREAKFEADVVDGGLTKFFAEPKPEHFTNVDGMKKDAAYEVALQRYKSRMEWAAKIRKEGGSAPPEKQEPPAK